MAAHSTPLEPVQCCSLPVAVDSLSHTPWRAVGEEGAGRSHHTWFHHSPEHHWNRCRIHHWTSCSCCWNNCCQNKPYCCCLRSCSHCSCRCCDCPYHRHHCRRVSCHPCSDIACDLKGNTSHQKPADYY